MDLLQFVHVGALILDQETLTWFLAEVPNYCKKRITTFTFSIEILFFYKE